MFNTNAVKMHALCGIHKVNFKEKFVTHDTVKRAAKISMHTKLAYVGYAKIISLESKSIIWRNRIDKQLCHRYSAM